MGQTFFFQTNCFIEPNNFSKIQSKDISGNNGLFDLLKSQQRTSIYSDTTTCLRAVYTCHKIHGFENQLFNRKALISSQATENSKHVPINCKLCHVVSIWLSKCYIKCLKFINLNLTFNSGTHGKCTSRYPFYNLLKLRKLMTIFREVGSRWYERLDRHSPTAE